MSINTVTSSGHIVVEPIYEDVVALALKNAYTQVEASFGHVQFVCTEDYNRRKQMKVLDAVAPLVKDGIVNHSNPAQNLNWNFKFRDGGWSYL